MSSEALPQIPGYEVVRKLGAGSIGVVYLVETLSEPRRRVAIKLLRDRDTLREKELRRFLREGKAGQALRHPHIVPVHDCIPWEGSFAIVMAYVEGTTLLDSLPTRSSARFFAGGSGSGREVDPTALRQELPGNLHLLGRVAEALRYAHDQGLVHRDIKPGNILVRDGDRHPFLVDFGLVKDLRGDSTLSTSTGALLGSPSYMSPEQLTGRVRDVAPPSDIYSLGVTVFEVSTGRVPFRGESYEELRERVLAEEPPSITKFLPDPPPGLQEVILKAMEKRPAHRYPDAAALGADLDRIARGELPRVSRTAIRFRQGLRKVRRRRFPLAVAAVLLLSVLATSLALAIGAYRGRLLEARIRQHYDQAQMHLDLGQLGECLRELDAAIDLRPEEVEGYLRRAAAYSELGNRAASAAQVREAVSRGFSFEPSSQETPQRCLYLGLHDLARGDSAGAERWLEEALAKDRGLYRAVMPLSLVKTRLGHHKEALELLQKYKKTLRPVDPRSTVVLAQILERQNRFAEALSTLRGVGAEPPLVLKELRYHAHLGRILVRLLRWDEAFGVLEKAIAENPDDAPSLCHLGLVHLRRGQKDTARDKALAGLEIDPSLEIGYRILAFGGGETDTAREILDSLSGTMWAERKIRLLDAEDLFDEGERELSRGRAVEAQDLFRASIETNPHQVDALLRLASAAWVDDGDHERALGLFLRSRDAWSEALEQESNPWGGERLLWNAAVLTRQNLHHILIGIFACAVHVDEEGEAEEALARLRQELSGRPEAGAGNVLNLAEALALCPVERFRDCDWALQLLEEYDIDPADFGPDAAGASKILADIRRSCRAGGER